MADRKQELEDRIEELQTALANIENQERKTQLDAHKPIWEYRIEPVEEDRNWDRLYDDSCKFVRLSGRVVNKEEARAAGHSLHFGDGGMQYVYNTLSKKIVCSTGGGNIYVSDPETMEELSRFFTENPEGGDVTLIVLAGRQRSKE